MKIFGGKKVLSINHSLLQIKIASCKCLRRILQNFYHSLSQEQIAQLVTLYETEIVKNTTGEIKKSLISVLCSVLKALPEQQAVLIFDKNIAYVLNYVASHYGTDGLDITFDLQHLVYKLLKALTRGLLPGQRKNFAPTQIEIFKEFLT